MWPWRVKMPTQNLLRLLLLLMLMLRIMLATVCYRFGSWRLILKLNFFSEIEHKGWSRFWSWSSGKILKLELVQHFAADVLLRLGSWILVDILKVGLVKILKLKFRQDLQLEIFLPMFCRGHEVESWLIFWSYICLNKFYGEADVWLRFWSRDS